MSLPVFNFPFHSPTHVYQKGDSFQFGRGYQFNAAPLLPMQRTFRLTFKGMCWFQNAQGQYDPTINPQLNIYTLLQFYEAQFTNLPFTYPHDVYGQLTVKFSAANAFEVPKTIDGGTGMTEGFEMMIVEQLL